MKPDYTEFSYGFALTYELANAMGPFPIAPHFPSLYEEGKPGEFGGTDVALDRPGLPIFLQFKRSHEIATKAGIEWKAAQKAGLNLPKPYLRFLLMTDTKSDQHDLLRALNTKHQNVYYAAPRYHTRTKLNEAWRNQTIVHDSIFVRPNDIGRLDKGRHAVAFDRSWMTHALLCSEPVEVPISRATHLFESMASRLTTDRLPLFSMREDLFEGILEAYKLGSKYTFERLEELWETQQATRRRVRSSQDLRGGEDGRQEKFKRPNRVTFDRQLSSQIDAVWNARTDDVLRDVALESQRLFGCTMAIVQPKE